MKTTSSLVAFVFLSVAASVSSLECYHCFYVEDPRIGNELKNIFGKSMDSCDKNPPECSLQSEAGHRISADESEPELSYRKTGQFSFAILNPAAPKSNTGVQATYDHCVIVNGTIDGQRFVFRTGRYFGEHMNGQCIETQTGNVKGMRVIEKDCYCNMNKCNSGGVVNKRDDCSGLDNGVNNIKYNLIFVITTLSVLLINFY